MIDMRKSDQLESAHAEIEAVLNILIELMLAETDSMNEDAACLLMRVRHLSREIRPDFLSEEKEVC